MRGKQKEIEQLKRKITEQGKGQVIETVAYTWFNRLMALRFMDANGYTIPKVVTPLPGMTNPEILQNALGGNVEAELKLDRQRLNDLLDGKTAATDAHTEAYKMLLVASCNQWHTAMPFMFERISDYTELLLPDDLLSDYSIVADIRNGMSNEDCQQEELIGWLYQFYIADKKDDVFEGLKKNIKITAENIPAATQLFTPRWIVRYMVENTLGKLWLTLKPNSKLRQHMPYYIEAPEGNNAAPLPEGIKGVTDITFLDPCQGSGHVLVYAFDLFTKIYEEEGYNTNEIPALILEHNLFGIDIDERTAQLAAFALTMKARSYYTRFLRKPVQPHVIALENVNEDIIKQAVKLPLQVAEKLVYDYKDLTLYNLTQADNFGSLIQINPEELKALSIQKGSIWQEQEQNLKEQAEYLSRQYHCVVTNPPYMGSDGMNNSLKLFVFKYYPLSKEDLMATFIERCASFTIGHGYFSFINQQSWMFIVSYFELRRWIIENQTIISALHLGPRTFPEISGEKVQSISIVFQKDYFDSNSTFFRLVQFKTSKEKEASFHEANRNSLNGIKYYFNQKNVHQLPTLSIGAYIFSQKALEAFSKGVYLKDIGEARQGIATGNNDLFTKKWYEVSVVGVLLGSRSLVEFHQNNGKYAFFNKGGGFRKWHINLLDVIRFDKKYYEMLGNSGNKLPSKQFYFKKGISWSKVSKIPSFRYMPDGNIFSDSGQTIFEFKDDLLISFLNSNVVSYLLSGINDSINFTIKDIEFLPFFIDSQHRNEISSLQAVAMSISEEEWSSKETSFSFKKCPLLFGPGLLETSIADYSSKITRAFIELFKAECSLNKLYIDNYGLTNYLKEDTSIKLISVYEEELEIDENSNSITANKAALVNNLISYSLGIVFGRYSLDKSGLILASQGQTLQDYFKQVQSPTFMPDEDNIIPVLDGEWFNDDIVGRFKVFLKAAFGEEHFEENLKYIEDTIGKDIRKYFVKDFYNDHIKRYKKRPIYWMFSSPKGHFKALIYMHRYQPDLCSKMLNDYLQAFISKLEAAKQTQTMLSLREDLSAREKTAAIKEIDKLELMLKDCREYEKTLFTIATQKISIDLDDGVKVNYHKFKEVLVPIKGLEKEEE